MAEDFRAKITAELDTAAAENKLEAFLNKKNKLKIDVEVNQDLHRKRMRINIILAVLDRLPEQQRFTEQP